MCPITSSGLSMSIYHNTRPPLPVHEYFGVDLEIVWNVIEDDLPLLMDAVKKILEAERDRRE
jgi:uncharacterized protein with HEPN domain